MWFKPCLAICAALTFFSTSSAKALLVDGSYIIELTGESLNGRSVIGNGRFDVIGMTIQNFAMDLLSGRIPANASSMYVDDDLELDDDGLTMFEGGAENVLSSQGLIIFDEDGTWECRSSTCGSSGGNLLMPSGDYSISEVPLPAALWLLLSALISLRLFGWKSRKRATA